MSSIHVEQEGWATMASNSASGKKVSRNVGSTEEARALEVGLARGGFFKLSRGQAEAARSMRRHRQG